MKQVHVAVGVVQRADEIFVTKRAEHLHQGGKWEFPGGKVESGETVEQALERELQEEIGISKLTTSPLCEIRHDYGDKQVFLETLLVTGFEGEPFGKEGQLSQWIKLADLQSLEFPAANKAIIEALLR